MDLFAAAGYDPEEGARGRAGRHAAARTQRLPLFNYKVVEAARARAAFHPTPAQSQAAREYARKVSSRNFIKVNEVSFRDQFYDLIFVDLLGYRKLDPEAPYGLHIERAVRSGSADAALGRFNTPEGHDQVLAPVELKGPARDLDAIEPGGRRSPVQQAWDYANDAPGVRWVLVSNFLELRLYGFGYGREAYEMFDLKRLDDVEELARLWLILAADRLLTGETEMLLRETDSAYREISGKLYEEYSALRSALIAFLVDFSDGPKLHPLKAIEVAQKLLDRVLFIAFAQRTNLLGDGHLKEAAESRNVYDPDRPVWRNFQTLFRWLDEGRRDRDIPDYNGGLFATDPLLDSIILPDHLATDLARLGEWDYRSDVPVTVLGHLFEQSVTDIEKLKAESEGRPPPSVSTRKRHGIVYTPDIVTRFLVERTIGLTLDERFEALLEAHGRAGIARTNGGRMFGKDEGPAERAFWRDYLAVLRSITVIDPACGSGAFLVAAFDVLAAEYGRVVDRLDALGEPVDFDRLDEIVTRNLHGVDLSSESVEITRLSLWLKTARRKHRLQNLEATIKAGDSLIDDPEVTRNPFDWRAVFPAVFQSGGFDVVIGNPPYVRMELIKPLKPYLEKNYRVATDRADLYAYFFERGVELLKPGGRLGYISSSTFFRTGSGDRLRAFLTGTARIETVIDFGDRQVFEGVTTYPAILTLKKEADGHGGELRFLSIRGGIPRDLGTAFREDSKPMPRSRLGSGSWRFEEEPLARLRDKIATGKRTLGEVYGPPLYGIKTGLNEAFIIDTETRDRLVARDPKSAELLKPFLRGENIKRWRIEPEGLFLINTPKGKVDIDAYPAVRDWLLPFRPELEKRATDQQWFELQQAQLAYQPLFEKPKIIYGHFANEQMFAWDRERFYSNDKSYILPDAPLELLAFLNSQVSWFFITGIAPAVRHGWHEMRVQYVELTPLPDPAENERKRLAELSAQSLAAARSRLHVQTAVRTRFFDLAASHAPGKLTKNLEHWWELDFSEFRKEVNRVFRADIRVRERSEWEQYLAHKGAIVLSLSAEIEAAEREIDSIVYRLFGLTDEEVRLLESSLEEPGRRAQ